jgi:acyl-CoA synthetase (NDP forming)
MHIIFLMTTMVATSSKKILKSRLKSKQKNLTEPEARIVLEKYKIPLVKSEFAENEEAAEKAAKKIGYPVVMKIVSRDVVHKSVAGGVVVNIDNNMELHAAYKKILANVKKKFRRAKIGGMVVQKMVESSKEFIIGSKKDAQFGSVIMFGSGGVMVEVLEDVAFRVVPINADDAIDMMQEIKGYKILKDADANVVKNLTDILLKVSKMLEENPEIAELDINPVKILKNSVIAVDARIVVG